MKQDLGLVAQRVRGHVVEMIGKARSGHPGGSLSATDILTFLYFQKNEHRPPKSPLGKAGIALCCPKAMQHLPSTQSWQSEVFPH